MAMPMATPRGYASCEMRLARDFYLERKGEVRSEAEMGIH